jgi:ribonuclease HII
MRSAKSSPPEQASLPWHPPAWSPGWTRLAAARWPGPWWPLRSSWTTCIPLLAWPTPKSSPRAARGSCLTRSAPGRCVLQHCRSQRGGDRPLNILQATLLAMRRAVLGLRLKPKMVLVDGNRLPVLDIPAEAIVKGDALVPAISAASILAKVHRDRWCVQVMSSTPIRLCRHKGYGTAVHMAALREHGACIHHRAALHPWPRCWSEFLRCRLPFHCPPRTPHDLRPTVISRATTLLSKTCVGWRRTARPTASRAGSGWRATTCAAPRCSAACSPAIGGVFRVFLAYGPRCICASSY